MNVSISFSKGSTFQEFSHFDIVVFFFLIVLTTHKNVIWEVLLTWPTASPKSNTDFDYDNDDTFSTSYSAPWTQADADQIKRAAYSLGVGKFHFQ